MTALEVTAARKPRVLFIASSFPPANRPGSPRTSNIALALAGSGWDVTVLTVDPAQWVRLDPDHGLENRLADSGVRRLTVANPWPSLTGGLLHRSRFTPAIAARALRKACTVLQIDPEIGWTRAALKAARRLEGEQFDLVFASAPPFAVLTLAMRIADRLRLPYAVDYRDLWTLNPMRKRPPAARHVRRDREVLARAAAATVVSPSLAELLRAQPGAAEKVHVLPNGYRREDLENVRPTAFGHFAILYAGTFYLPHRSIRPILEALALLERREALAQPWKFHYYGHQGSHVASVAAEVGLPESRIELHGAVPRAEVLAATAGAGLVTVITTVNREGTLADRGVVTGKIFEAVGLERPMLVIAPPASDVESVLATAGRGRVIAGTEIESIASYIAHVANGGRIAGAVQPDAYEWSRLGERLSAILSGALMRERLG
jgi:glycosyltransferase involved in cell wall biosynthesis